MGAAGSPHSALHLETSVEALRQSYPAKCTSAYHDRLGSNERGLVRGQKCDCACDIIGLAQARYKLNLVHIVILAFLRKARDHFICADQAGATPQTLIPSPASSFASATVKPRTASLEMP